MVLTDLSLKSLRMSSIASAWTSSDQTVRANRGWADKSKYLSYIWVLFRALPRKLFRAARTIIGGGVGDEGEIERGGDHGERFGDAAVGGSNDS